MKTNREVRPSLSLDDYGRTSVSNKISNLDEQILYNCLTWLKEKGNEGENLKWADEVFN